MKEKKLEQNKRELDMVTKGTVKFGTYFGYSDCEIYVIDLSECVRILPSDAYYADWDCVFEDGSISRCRHLQENMQDMGDFLVEIIEKVINDKDFPICAFLTVGEALKEIGYKIPENLANRILAIENN